MVFFATSDSEVIMIVALVFAVLKGSARARSETCYTDGAGPVLNF